MIPVKTQVTRDWTERPRGASLQPDIEFWYLMYRIGGRLRYRVVRFGGVNVGIPPFEYWNSNLEPLNRFGDSVRRAV